MQQRPHRGFQPPFILVPSTVGILPRQEVLTDGQTPKPSSHQPAKKHPGAPTPPTRASGDPVFGQPQPSPDPTTFKNPVTDASQPDVAGVQPFIAVHHPPFTGGTNHGGSRLMLADIDSACTAAGVWPHAVFSGHAHNYQRYTRLVNACQIPFMVAGCGGHSPLSSMRSTVRTPYKIESTLTLESYDDTDYGYLRVIVNASTMTIEFHPQHDGGTTKTPDDVVTINLASRTIS